MGSHRGTLMDQGDANWRSSVCEEGTLVLGIQLGVSNRRSYFRLIIFKSNNGFILCFIYYYVYILNICQFLIIVHSTRSYT